MHKVKLFRSEEILCNKDEDGNIGQGGYGTVRIGYHEILGVLAVKCFAMKGGRREKSLLEKKIKKELGLLQQAQHDNIVRVHGWTQWHGSMAIIMEYLPAGNLRIMLLDTDIVVSPLLRLRICAEISTGIVFIHNLSANKRLVHGDIKPENILLSEDLHCKIADFGSAQLSSYTGSTSTATRSQRDCNAYTLLYTAPERLESISIRTTSKYDTYSVGMTFHMVLTREIPVALETKMEIFRSNILAGQRPNVQGIYEQLQMFKNEGNDDDVAIMQLLKDEMERCWQQNPEDRPDMINVKDRLCSKLANRDVATVQQHVADALLEMEVKKPSFESEKYVSIDRFNPPYFNTTIAGINQSELKQRNKEMVVTAGLTTVFCKSEMISRESRTEEIHSYEDIGISETQVKTDGGKGCEEKDDDEPIYYDICAPELVTCSNAQGDVGDNWTEERVMYTEAESSEYLVHNDEEQIERENVEKETTLYEQIVVPSSTSMFKEENREQHINYVCDLGLQESAVKEAKQILKMAIENLQNYAYNCDSFYQGSRLDVEVEINNLKSFISAKNNEPIRKEIADELVTLKAVPVFFKWLNIFTANGHRYPTESNFRECFRPLRDVIWNATSVSVDFCVQCGETNVLEMFVSDLKSLQNPMNDEHKEWYVWQAINILCNCAMFSSSLKYVKQLNIFHLIYGYSRDSMCVSKNISDAIILLSSILSAYLAEREDVYMISTDKTMIFNLIDDVSDIMKSDQGGFQWWSLPTFLGGLANLARNPDNSFIIYEKPDIVVWITNLLLKGNKEEKMLTLELIENLSSVIAIKKKLKQEETIFKLLKSMRIEESDRHLRRKTDELLPVLTKEKKSGLSSKIKDKMTRKN